MVLDGQARQIPPTPSEQFDISMTKELNPWYSNFFKMHLAQSQAL